MFEELVKVEYPDLYTDAHRFSIPLNTFLQGFYEAEHTEAVTTLKRLITAKRRELEDVDHVAAFVAANTDAIDQLAAIADGLMNSIENYNNEHNTLLRVDFQRLANSDDSTDIVIMSRMPKGSRVRPQPRDLSILYARAKEAGYDTSRLRLGGAGRDYVYGELTPEGKILYDGVLYNGANEWKNAVRGDGNSRAGSPYKVVFIADEKRKYITLDKAFNLLMYNNTS